MWVLFIEERQVIIPVNKLTIKRKGLTLHQD